MCTLTKKLIDTKIVISHAALRGPHIFKGEELVSMTVVRQILSSTYWSKSESTSILKALGSSQGVPNIDACGANETTGELS
jgi:hypothetical protein